MIATAFNNMKDSMVARDRLASADIATIGADTEVSVSPTMVSIGYHNDRSEATVTAEDPDDGEDDDGLAGALLLTNNLLGVYKFHMADTLAHKVAGVALASYVPATTLATAITRANDIKSKYGTHRASTTYHYVSDGVDTISASDATILSDLITLLIELKADFNSHMASGPAAASLRLVDA